MLPTSEYVTTHDGAGLINAVLAGVLGLLCVTVFVVGALALRHHLYRARAARLLAPWLGSLILLGAAVIATGSPVYASGMFCGGVGHSAASHGVEGDPRFAEAEEFTQPCRDAGRARLGVIGLCSAGSGVLIGATGLLLRRARRADPEHIDAGTPGSAPGGTRTVTA